MSTQDFNEAYKDLGITADKLKTAIEALKEANTPANVEAEKIARAAAETAA